MNRALFLDRDGVVDDLVYYPSHGEWESPRHVSDVKMREEAFEALRNANRNGWLLFVITNQPSYAKGKCPLEDLQAVHARVMKELELADVRITESFICFHHPTSTVAGYGACECRKPSPFLIVQAAKKHHVDLSRSWMVGDQDTDVVTGRNAGCRTALLRYEHSQDKRGGTQPDLICEDLADFIRKLD